MLIDQVPPDVADHRDHLPAHTAGPARRARVPGWLAGLTIFAVAVAVRAMALGGRSWWIDELITRNTGRLPLWRPGFVDAAPPAHTTHSILAYVLHDTGPGLLAYLVEGMFARWAEPLGHEWLLRLPGVIAGIGTVLVALLLGRRWLGGRYGALAMGALFAVLPLFVEASTGGRAYAWLVLVAVLQLGLLDSLAGSRGTRFGGRALWPAMILLALAGFFVNVIHAVFNCAILCGLLLARRLSCSRAARLRAGLFWGGVVAAALPQVLWALAWIPRVSGGGRPPNRSITAFVARCMRWLPELMITQPATAVSICALPLIIPGVLWLWSRRRKRPVLLASVVTLGVTMAFALALLFRFMLVPRYLYGVMVCGCWVAGACVEKCCAILRARRGRRTADVAAYAGVVIVLAGLWPAAVRTAVTPVHDWATTVAFLKPLMRPGDVVLCGPNSDHEVFAEYARAAGIPNPPVVRYFDQYGRVHDSATIEGLRSVLETPNRLWFVTAFWGWVRPTEYWTMVESNFREVQRIPGQGDIRIMVREPADQTTTVGR